jgi:hypothetical protein
VIKPEDLAGVNTDLASRIISFARTIAPCLDSLVDGADADDRKYRSEAIAVLKGVASDGRQRFRGVKTQRSGTSAAEFVVNGSSFTDEDRASLRALCEASTTAALPVGEFPRPSRAIARMWPEERC